VLTHLPRSPDLALVTTTVYGLMKNAACKNISGLRRFIVSMRGRAASAVP